MNRGSAERVRAEQEKIPHRPKKQKACVLDARLAI